MSQVHLYTCPCLPGHSFPENLTRMLLGKKQIAHWGWLNHPCRCCSPILPFPKSLCRCGASGALCSQGKPCPASSKAGSAQDVRVKEKMRQRKKHRGCEGKTLRGRRARPLSALVALSELASASPRAQRRTNLKMKTLVLLVKRNKNNTY